MLQAAKRCNKVEGTIVPATLRDCCAARITTLVLRLRSAARSYAQDDTGVVTQVVTCGGPLRGIAGALKSNVRQAIAPDISRAVPYL